MNTCVNMSTSKPLNETISKALCTLSYAQQAVDIWIANQVFSVSYLKKNNPKNHANPSNINKLYGNVFIFYQWIHFAPPFFFTLNENRYFTIISVYSSRFVKIYIKYNY